MDIVITDACLHHIITLIGLNAVLPNDSTINQWLMDNYGLTYQKVDGKHTISGKVDDIKWFYLSGLV